MVMTISYARDSKGSPKPGSQYSLTAVNESAQPWVFYVYQKMPNQTTRDVLSLAWFASPYKIRVGSRIRFEWTTDYDFIWSDTGQMVPGVEFYASGLVDADPNGANSTEFSLTDGPGLSKPTQEPPKGSLVIHDASDVPNDRFSVGIGMSGSGIYAVQAGANLNHQFTPGTPAYWVAAGVSQQIGTALDVQTITHTAAVKFEPNVYNKTATLKQDNSWDITSS